MHICIKQQFFVNVGMEIMYYFAATFIMLDHLTVFFIIWVDYLGHEGTKQARHGIITIILLTEEHWNFREQMSCHQRKMFVCSCFQTFSHVIVLFQTYRRNLDRQKTFAEMVLEWSIISASNKPHCGKCLFRHQKFVTRFFATNFYILVFFTNVPRM